MAGLAGLDLLDLAGYLVVLGLGVEGLHVLLEALQFLADAACRLAFGLLFAYLTNGVLYLAVALLQQVFGLLLGLGQDVAALTLHGGNVVLIVVDLLLQPLLLLMDGLSFLLPVALVAHDVL